MANCVNMNSKEFQDLVEKSGLNPLVLKSEIGVIAKYTNSEEIPTLGELEYYHESKREALSDTTLFSELLQEEGYGEIFNKEKFEERQIEALMASPVRDIPSQSNASSPSNTAKNLKEYLAYKEQLLEKIETHLADYKRLNSSHKKSEVYKRTVRDFTDTLEKLRLEISSLKTAKESDFLFGELFSEIEFLSKELEEKDPFKTENYEIIFRLNTLSKLILRQELSGQEIPANAFFIDGEDVEGFSDLVSNMVKLQNQYQTFVKEVAKQAIIENPLFVMSAKELGEEDLEKFFEGFASDMAKDIDFFSENFLGINSSKDSVFAKGINNIFQTNIKKVQQNVNRDTFRVEELWHILKGKNFNFEDFVMKDKSGVVTDQLISLYTEDWRKTISRIYSYRKDVSTKNDALKGPPYRTFIKELAGNAEVIDIRKLKVFKEMYGDLFEEYFVFSDSEMDAYEEGLKNILGKGYQEEIDSQIDSISQYIDYIQDLEFKRDPKLKRQKLQNNPFAFVKSFYTPDERGKGTPLKTADAEVFIYNLGSYNRFIPREKNSLGEDSGFYNSDFKSKVEVDDDVYEMWSLLKKLLSEHINPAYASNEKYIKPLTLPAVQMDFLESLAKIKSQKGVSTMLKETVARAINAEKDLYFTNFNEADSGKLVANYSDTAKKEVQAMTSALVLQTREVLLQKASAIGLSFKEEDSKRDIAYSIARATIMPNYSTDIVRNILAVTELAVMQRARRESAFLVEMLYDLHVNMPSNETKKIKFLGNVKDGRESSNRKLRTWIETNIYGSRNKSEGENVLTKSKKKRYSEVEKQILKILKETTIDGETEFFFDGKRYFQDNGKYKTSEKSGDPEKGKERVVTITQDAFEEAFGAYIASKTDALGTAKSFTGYLQGAMAFYSRVFLGFNIKSGVKNRLEGWLQNMIRDAEGYYWEPGTLKYATRFLASSTTYRMVGRKPLDLLHKKKMDQLFTLELLLEKWGVLQDRRDFRDKKDKVSTFSQLKKGFGLYNFSVGNPEFKNQSEDALCIMSTFKVKDAFGREVPLFNKTGILLDEDGKIIDRGVYLPIYKPGTIYLRDEFKYTREAFDSNGVLREDINLEDYINPENIGYESYDVNFDNLEQNQVHLLTTRISDAINKTQGNFSNLDSIKVMNSILGRVIMMFKRYLPEHINQRFGFMDANLATGQKAYEGRYRVLFRNSGALSVTSSAIATVLFGPVGGISALGVGTVLPFILNKVSKKWFGKQATKGVAENLYLSVGMLQEVLLRTINLPLRVALPTSKDLHDIELLNKNRGFEKVLEKEVLTEAEVGSLRAMAQETANQIGLILVMIGLKSLFGGDDDDEEDKKTRNFIDNFGNELLKGFSQYYNPKTMWDETTSVLLFGILEDTFKFLSYVFDYVIGDGDIKKVGKQAEKIANPIPRFVMKTYRHVTGDDPFLQDDKEYNPNQWFDSVNIPEEVLAEKYLKNQRSELKEIYISEIEDRLAEDFPEMSSKERKKYAEELSKKLMKDPEVAKQTSKGETSIQAKERIDFEEAKEKAEAVVNEFDLETNIEKLDKAEQKKKKKAEDWADSLGEEGGELQEELQEE